MAIMSILAISVFSTVICIVEIPKMLEQRLYRELWILYIAWDRHGIGGI